MYRELWLTLRRTSDAGREGRQHTQFLAQSRILKLTREEMDGNMVTLVPTTSSLTRPWRGSKEGKVSKFKDWCLLVWDTSRVLFSEILSLDSFKCLKSFNPRSGVGRLFSPVLFSWIYFSLRHEEPRFKGKATSGPKGLLPSPSLIQ